MKVWVLGFQIRDRCVTAKISRTDISCTLIFRPPNSTNPAKNHFKNHDKNLKRVTHLSGIKHRAKEVSKKQVSIV